MRKIIFIFLFLIVTCSVVGQNINHQNIPCPMGLYVNSYNGNLFFKRTDVFINARKLPLDLSFYYNSNSSAKNDGFGNGWSMEYLMRYEGTLNGGIRITRGDGFVMEFTNASPNLYKAPSGVFDTLVRSGSNFVLITKEKTQYHFSDSAHKRLTRIEEINGNPIKFQYSNSLITQISDSSGRTLNLVYQNGKLKEVNDNVIASQPRKTQYKYDSYGNLIEVIDPLGQKFKYQYLINGPLNKLIDKNQNAVDIVYSSSYLVKEIITCITQLRFSYDKSLGVTTMVQPVSGQNQITTYRYNSTGQIIQKEGNCCGFNTKFEYDNTGNVLKFTDGNGNSSNYTYDKLGQLLSKTDAANNTLQITYHSSGKVKSFTDKNGNTTSFTLNVNGNITSAAYPEGIINSFTYDANGDLKKSTDGKGYATSYIYDSNGNVAQIIKPQSVIYIAAYDQLSRLISTTDPNGNNTTFSYDKLDRIIKITDANNDTISIQYDANNNVIKYFDRKGNLTKFDYDAADRLLKVTNALNYSVSAEYDENDNLIKFVDERGYFTQMKYDNLNRLTRVINAANEITQYAYSPSGKLINMVYPNGNNLTITRDARDKIVTISDNVGTVSQRQYDANGNTTSITNGLGNAISLTYDKLNRLIKRTDPLGHEELYQYDNNYNITSFTDKNGHQKIVAYDSLNRAITYKDALNALTSFTYDSVGNLTRIVDANQNPTIYTYNNLNRQTSTMYANGTVTQTSYDKNGNVVAYTDASNDTTNYIYDAIDQLLSIAMPTTGNYSYTYDPSGNMLTANNADANVSFRYDAMNRILKEAIDGDSTLYSYDIAAGTFQVKYPVSGRVITKNFDARNRLTSIMEGAQNLMTATYDAANRMTTRINGNGSTISYVYDAVGRLLNQTANTIPLTGFEFTYDNAGNKLSAKNLHKPTHSEQYVYDDEDQLIDFKYGSLTGVTISNPTKRQLFAYDNLGNRETLTDVNGNAIAYTSNNVNQYTQIASNNQIYDSKGNLTVDHNGVNYAYNDMNQLVNTNGTTLKYDALNRLINKVTLTDTTNYRYSFLNAIEINNTLSSVTNVFGSGLDNLIGFKRNGSNYYAMQNSVNSVNSISDNTNSIVEYYEYNPFGETFIYNSADAIQTTSVIGNPLQFGGRPNLGNNLYNFRFRYLSTEQGRFIQRDPLAYVDGMNLMSYAKSNPIILKDELGASCNSEFPKLSEKECKKYKCNYIKQLKQHENKFGTWKTAKDFSNTYDVDIHYDEIINNEKFDSPYGQIDLDWYTDLLVGGSKYLNPFVPVIYYWAKKTWQIGDKTYSHTPYNDWGEFNAVKALMEGVDSYGELFPDDFVEQQCK